MDAQVESARPDTGIRLSRIPMRVAMKGMVPGRILLTAKVKRLSRWRGQVPEHAGGTDLRLLAVCCAVGIRQADKRV